MNLINGQPGVGLITAVITWGVLAVTPPHLSHISAQTCTKNNEHEKYETVANV